MLRGLEDAACGLIERDICWWGMRRHRPRADRPYTSRLLLAVCLAYGLPLAAIVYAQCYAAALLLRTVNPLADDTGWLPRGAAWAAFVLNALLNAITCWLWNRRAARLAPAAARRRVG